MKSLSMRYAIAGLLIGILLGLLWRGWPGGESAGAVLQQGSELVGNGIAGALIGWGAGALKARQLKRKNANDERQNPYRDS